MIKIISISKSGNSGQPLSAQLLNADLQSFGVSVRHANIADRNAGTFGRLMVFKRLLRFIKKSPRNFYLVHLNIETLFLQMFKWRNVIFINHGVYDFANKKSLFRLINIAVLYWSSKIMGNRVYFVNKDQAKIAGSNFVLPNRINTIGLSKKFRTIDDAFPLRHIGFVGRNDMQKNLGVLQQLIVNSPNFQFHHLGPKPILEFCNLSNYQHMPSEKRSKFFATIDLLLMPSRYESFGLVAYEANYCNIPVIHSGQDGLKDVKFGYNLRSANGDVWTCLNLAELTPAQFPASGDRSLQNARLSAIQEIVSVVKNFDNHASL